MSNRCLDTKSGFDRRRDEALLEATHALQHTTSTLGPGSEKAVPRARSIEFTEVVAGPSHAENEPNTPENFWRTKVAGDTLDFDPTQQEDAPS